MDKIQFKTLFNSRIFNSKFDSKCWNWQDSIQEYIHSIRKRGYRSPLLWQMHVCHCCHLSPTTVETSFHQSPRPYLDRHCFLPLPGHCCTIWVPSNRICKYNIIQIETWLSSDFYPSRTYLLQVLFLGQTVKSQWGLCSVPCISRRTL